MKTTVPVATVAQGLKICQELASICPNSGTPLIARPEKSVTSIQNAPPR